MQSYDITDTVGCRTTSDPKYKAPTQRWNLSIEWIVMTATNLSAATKKPTLCNSSTGGLWLGWAHWADRECIVDRSTLTIT